MKFSLEIGPQTNLDTVPQVNDVYITMLPGGDYKETAQQAVELVKRGYNPVPHFPARSMQDEKQLKDYVSRCKDGGVKQVLVIGGGREPMTCASCSPSRIRAFPKTNSATPTSDDSPKRV